MAPHITAKLNGMHIGRRQAAGPHGPRMWSTAKMLATKVLKSLQKLQQEQLTNKKRIATIAAATEILSTAVPVFSFQFSFMQN